MDAKCGVRKMAGATRLELAAFCVTGRRSNQLNYAPSVVLYAYVEAASKRGTFLSRLFCTRHAYSPFCRRVTCSKSAGYPARIYTQISGVRYVEIHLLLLACTRLEAFAA